MRIISPRHAARGRSYVAPRIYSMGLEHSVVADVLDCIGHHHDLRKLVESEAGSREFFRMARCADTELIYLLEVADILERICEEGVESQLEFLELFKMACEEHGV